METAELEKKIKNIFGGSLGSYSEDRNRKTAVVYVDGNEITFDKLALLSKLFKTKNINIGSRIVREGWCETCSYDTTKVEIYINGANFGDN